MARTPTTSIFQGISAISDAGGIDGFTREVLAESKRIAMQRQHQRGPVGDANGAFVLLFECVTDALMRRLEADIERGFGERVASAIERCKSRKKVLAASERALAEATAWSRDLLNAVQETVMGLPAGQLAAMEQTA